MKTRERLAYMVLGGLLGWHEDWLRQFYADQVMRLLRD